MPNGAAVDGAVAPLAGHVRGDAQGAHAFNEGAHFVALVGADAHATSAAAAPASQQAQAGLALGGVADSAKPRCDQCGFGHCAGIAGDDDMDYHSVGGWLYECNNGGVCG